MCSCKTVISFGKVPVERSDNRVLAVGIINMTCPLADAGTAGIGKYHTAYFFKCINKPISL